MFVPKDVEDVANKVSILQQTTCLTQKVTY